MNLRADARRNRARVLEAAETLFAEEGLSASTEDIARRADVGIGTVFRHFPTKHALAEAVVVHGVRRLVDEARELEGDGAFFTFFFKLAEQARRSVALREALDGELGSELDDAKRDLDEVGRSLLARAQAAGVVRGDVTPDDVKALIAGCLAMENRAIGPPGRMIAIVCDGLRPDSRTAGAE